MAIKIILTEPVDHLGDPGDIVQVAPGYARNYLFPRRVALEASEGNLRMLESKRKVWEEQQKRDVDRAEVLQKGIQAADLRFVRKSGEKGTLFGSVTNADIAEKLAELGVTVDRKQIAMKHPLKSLGEHVVTFRLHRKVVFQTEIVVEPEALSPEEAAELKARQEAEEKAAAAAAEGAAEGEEGALAGDAEATEKTGDLEA